MPVRKFRSVEEMNRETWREPGSIELYEAIRAVWEFGRRTSSRRFRPGVHRYRSIEEMQRGLERITFEVDRPKGQQSRSTVDADDSTRA